MLELYHSKQGEILKLKSGSGELVLFGRWRSFRAFSLTGSYIIGHV